MLVKQAAWFAAQTSRNQERLFRPDRGKRPTHGWHRPFIVVRGERTNGKVGKKIRSCILINLLVY